MRRRALILSSALPLICGVFAVGAICLLFDVSRDTVKAAMIFVSIASITAAGLHLRAIIDYRSWGSPILLMASLSEAYIYLFIQIIIGFIFSGMPMLPTRITLMAQVALFVACLVVFCLLRSAGIRIISDENEARRSMSAMRTLALEAHRLEQDAFHKGIPTETIRKLREAIEYSDPMGTSSTADFDEELLRGIDSIEEDIGNNQRASIDEKCQSLIDLISERNQRCRASK